MSELTRNVGTSENPKDRLCRCNEVRFEAAPEAGGRIEVLISDWPDGIAAAVWVEVAGSAGLGSALSFLEPAEAREIADALTACANQIEWDHRGPDSRGGVPV